MALLLLMKSGSSKVLPKKPISITLYKESYAKHIQTHAKVCIWESSELETR